MLSPGSRAGTQDSSDCPRNFPTTACTTGDTSARGDEPPPQAHAPARRDQARLAVEELVAGPTTAEGRHGLTTAIPVRPRFRSLTIETHARGSGASIDLAGLPSAADAGAVMKVRVTCSARLAARVSVPPPSNEGITAGRWSSRRARHPSLASRCRYRSSRAGGRKARPSTRSRTRDVMEPTQRPRHLRHDALRFAAVRRERIASGVATAASKGGKSAAANTVCG